ncbi:hypothetical protein [Vibrio campbellii]|uniref:hypothetical protein n=1 Tax=Vibrio campbellii TaxID=680 RepID=UPI0015C4ADB8|nr:hypothetical protein [Vibrio campbellii]
MKNATMCNVLMCKYCWGVVCAWLAQLGGLVISAMSDQWKRVTSHYFTELANE